MPESFGNDAAAPVLKLIPGEAKAKDEWITSGDYDINEIYVRATDKQGHSDSPRVKMPPHLWAEACAIVASGKIGYKTPLDLVRDAVYHRLHYWKEQLPNLDWRAFDVEEALAATERRTAGIMAREALIESNKAQLETLFNRRAWGSLNDTIEFVEEVAAGVLDEPWHTELVSLADEYRQRASQARQ